LARRCYLSRSEDQLNGYEQSQLQNARLLPPDDAAWFISYLNQDIDAEKRQITECAAIDQDHVEELLRGLSRQGDGAGTFLLAEQAGSISNMNSLARQAALQGFPEAQYEWALDLLNNQGVWHPQPGDPSAVDFLRGAADALAGARAMLAVCEYRGCNGEATDPQQAILDARMAAQQGDPDGMTNLAAVVPPGLIAPTEAQAWTLFDVALQERGCRGNGVSVNWMKSMATQLAKASSDAQAMADHYWELYGAGAMRNLGC
jgi:TPR repeat protein